MPIKEVPVDNERGSIGLDESNLVHPAISCTRNKPREIAAPSLPPSRDSSYIPIHALQGVMDPTLLPFQGQSSNTTFQELLARMESPPPPVDDDSLDYLPLPAGDNNSPSPLVDPALQPGIINNWSPGRLVNNNSPAPVAYWHPQVSSGYPAVSYGYAPVSYGPDLAPTGETSGSGPVPNPNDRYSVSQEDIEQNVLQALGGYLQLEGMYPDFMYAEPDFDTRNLAAEGQSLPDSTGDNTSFDNDQVANAEGGYADFSYQQEESGNGYLADQVLPLSDPAEQTMTAHGDQITQTEEEPVSDTVGAHDEALNPPLNQSDSLEGNSGSPSGTPNPAASTTGNVNLDRHGARNNARSTCLKARKNAGKGKDGQYDTYGDIPDYPSSDKALPADATLQEICEDFPNHLFGRHLDAFIQWKWTGLDIFKMIPPQVKAKLREEGVMSFDDNKNRANFLTKRLDKRMKDISESEMKDLIDVQPRRRCYKPDDPRRHLSFEGCSKLGGKYINPKAQRCRNGIEAPKLNGPTTEKASIKRKATEIPACAAARAAKKVKGSRECDDGKTEVEHQSRASHRVRDMAQPNVPTPQALPTPPESSFGLFSPIGSGVWGPQLNYDIRVLDATRHYQYVFDLATLWNQGTKLGHLVLRYDLDYRVPEQPGRDDMLLMLMGWLVNEQALALLQYDNVESLEEFAHFASGLFAIKAANSTNRLITNHAEALSIQKNVVDEILDTARKFNDNMLKWTTRATHSGMDAVKDFAKTVHANTLFGHVDQVGSSSGELRPYLDSTYVSTGSIAQPHHGNSNMGGSQFMTTNAGLPSPGFAYDGNVAPGIDPNLILGMDPPETITANAMFNLVESLNFDQGDIAGPQEMAGSDANYRGLDYPSLEEHDQVMPRLTAGLGKRTRDDEVDDEGREDVGGRKKRARFAEVEEAPRKIARARRPSKRS